MEKSWRGPHNIFYPACLWVVCRVVGLYPLNHFQNCSGFGRGERVWMRGAQRAQVMVTVTGRTIGLNSTQAKIVLLANRPVATQARVLVWQKNIGLCSRRGCP